MHLNSCHNEILNQSLGTCLKKQVNFNVGFQNIFNVHTRISSIIIKCYRFILTHS